MRRNVKFAGHLVARFDHYSKLYVTAARAGDRKAARVYLEHLERLRNILEFRYATIV